MNTDVGEQKRQADITGMKKDIGVNQYKLIKRALALAEMTVDHEQRERDKIADLKKQCKKQSRKLVKVSKFARDRYGEALVVCRKKDADEFELFDRKLLARERKR